MALTFKSLNHICLFLDHNKLNKAFWEIRTPKGLNYLPSFQYLKLNSDFDQEEDKIS